MGKNLNRAKLSKAVNGNEYHKMWIKYTFSPYWNEGFNYYPKRRPGFKNPNKRIMSYQVRMYKTWKYNRKTKWK